MDWMGLLALTFGGGFVGSLVQTWIAGRQERERRAFQAEQAEKQWEREEKRRKEQRYFEIKRECYEQFLVILLSLVNNDGSDEATKDSTDFFERKLRVYVPQNIVDDMVRAGRTKDMRERKNIFREMMHKLSDDIKKGHLE